MNKSTTVKIYDHNELNSVVIKLPRQAREHIEGCEIVVDQINNELHIREAIMMDNKRLKIQRDNKFTFTGIAAKELIGEYEFEIEGDYIILYKEG